MAKKILAVDDSKSMRQMVAMTLKSAGFDVTEGEDGVDGLNKAKAGHFDLVLTDINMPNMNGIELTRSLRALPASPRDLARSLRRLHEPRRTHHPFLLARAIPAPQRTHHPDASHQRHPSPIPRPRAG